MCIFMKNQTIVFALILAFVASPVLSDDHLQKMESKNDVEEQIQPASSSSGQDQDGVPKILYCGNRAGHTSTVLVPNAENRMQEVETIYGFSMFVDNTDKVVSARIAKDGTWEPQNIKLIGRIVRPGMNVLNLGSQTGLQALVMGKIIGEQGRIYVFEPYNISNAIVTKNMEINNMKDRATIFQKGASDKTDVATYRFNSANTGGSDIIEDDEQFLKKALDDKQKRYFTVEMMPVDEALPADVSLDFALIDVERMEIEALNGMRKVIEKSPNLVFMVEWQYKNNRNHDAEKTLSLLNFLKGLKYKFYKYTGGKSSLNCAIGGFVELKVEHLLGIGFDDIFFFPPTVLLPTNQK